MVIYGKLDARLATRKVLFEVTSVLLVEGVDGGRWGLVVTVLAAVAQHGAAHLGSTLTPLTADFSLIIFFILFGCIENNSPILARASTAPIQVSTLLKLALIF